MGVIEARRRILLSAPHVEATTPAGVANFSTDLIAPLKSCKVGFEPVQAGSGDPSPSNVRPISGWSGVTVYHSGMDTSNPTSIPVTFPAAGVNIWDEQWENGYILNGLENSSSVCIRSKNYNPVVPNRTYYLYCGSATSVYFVRPIFYDANKGYISDGSWCTNGTFTTPDNCYFIRLTTQSSSVALYGGTYKDDISVNYPSTDHEYHPYTNAYYGGYVDLVRGEVVATMAIDTSLNTKNWLYSANAGKFIVPLSRAYNSGSYSTSVVANIVCSHYKPISNVNAYNGAIDKGIGLPYYNGDPMLTIVDKDYTDASVFAATLSGVQLAYKLATPITYPLAPQIIKSLRGTNNIWSDANGDVSVEYWKH